MQIILLVIIAHECLSINRYIDLVLLVFKFINKPNHLLFIFQFEFVRASPPQRIPGLIKSRVRTIMSCWDEGNLSLPTRAIVHLHPRFMSDYDIKRRSYPHIHKYTHKYTYTNTTLTTLTLSIGGYGQTDDNILYNMYDMYALYIPMYLYIILLYIYLYVQYAYTEDLKTPLYTIKYRAINRFFSFFKKNITGKCGCSYYNGGYIRLKLIKSIFTNTIYISYIDIHTI